MQNDPGEALYARIWRTFVEGGQVEPWPRPTRGRHFRAEIVAIVNDPVLFRRLDRIRQAMAGFTYMIPVPDHFLHIPVVSLGPVAPRSARPGEWSARKLNAASARAGALLANAPPFTIDLASVATDGREVFAEVHPPAPLAALHDVLCPLAPVGVNDQPFLYRLPLAHAVGSAPGRGLTQAVEWFRDRPIGRVRVAGLTLIVVHARRLHPTRHRLAELPLGSAL